MKNTVIGKPNNVASGKIVGQDDCRIFFWPSSLSGGALKSLHLFLSLQ